MALTAEDKQWIELTLKPIQLEVCGIKEQLTRLNGKVAEHEKQISAALIERAQNREHQNTVEHIVMNTKQKVTKIEDNLQEYNMAKKYPKLFVVGMFVVGGCMVLMTLHSFGVF
jgi:glutaredoxin-related protein